MKYLKKFSLIALTCLFLQICSMDPGIDKSIVMTSSLALQHLLTLSIPEIKAFLHKPENDHLIVSFSLESSKELFLNIIENDAFLFGHEQIRKRFLSLSEADRIRFTKRPKNINLIAILKQKNPSDDLVRFMVKSHADPSPLTPLSQLIHHRHRSSHQSSAIQSPITMEPYLPTIDPLYRIKSLIDQATPSSSEAKASITSQNLMPNPIEIYKQIKARLTPEEKLAIESLDEQRQLRNLDNNPDFQTKLESLPGLATGQKTKLIYEELLPMIRRATCACGNKISRDLQYMQTGKDEAERDAQATILFGMFMKDLGEGIIGEIYHKIRHLREPRLRNKILYDLTIGSIQGLNQLMVYCGSEILGLMPNNLLDMLYQDIPDVSARINFPFENRTQALPHEVVQARKAEGRLQLALLIHSIMKDPSKSHEIVSAFAVESLMRKFAFGAAAGVFRTAPAHIQNIAHWLQNTKNGNDFNNFLMLQNAPALKLLPKAFTILQENSPIFKADYLLSQIPDGAILGFNPTYFSLGTTIGSMIIPSLSPHDNIADNQRDPLSIGTMSLLSSLANTSFDRIDHITLAYDQLTPAETLIEASEINWRSPYLSNIIEIETSYQSTNEPFSLGDFVVTGSVTPKAAIMILLSALREWKAANKAIHDTFEALKNEEQCIGLNPLLFDTYNQLREQTQKLFLQTLSAETYSERCEALIELNTMSTTRAPGRAGLFAEEAIDELSKLYFDSTTGELTKIKLTSSEQSASLSIYINYLKKTCLDKEEYMQQLRNAKKAGIHGLDNIIREASENSFSTENDKTWTRTFKQLWNRGKDVRLLHRLISSNPHNQLLIHTIAEIQDACHLGSKKNIPSLWQSIARNVALIRSNKSIPKIYRSTIKHLYQKYFIQLFGADVEIGSEAIPLVLTQVPAWRALTSEQRSDIFSDAQKRHALIESLSEIYLNATRIGNFLGLAQDSPLYPIVFDLTDAITNRSINSAELFNRILVILNTITKQERKKLIELLQPIIPQSMRNTKTAQQLAQENFRLGLNYLQHAEECTNATLGELYQKMGYFQALSNELHDLKLLKKYTFKGSVKTPQEETSQIAILQLTLQAIELLQKRTTDTHYVNALAQYLLHFAGTAQRAHELGLLSDATSLAYLPAALLGVCDINNLEKTIVSIGAKPAIQKIIGDNSEQFFATLKRYSNWMSSIQGHSPTHVITGLTTMQYDQEDIDQINNIELKTLYDSLQNQIISEKGLLHTMSQVQQNIYHKMMQYYIKVAQIIMYGHQIPQIEYKKRVAGLVKTITQQLKDLIVLNRRNELEEIKTLLNQIEFQIKKAQAVAELLMVATKIKLSQYGTYHPNSNALLGINFINDIIADNTALSSSKTVLTMYDEYQSPTAFNTDEIERIMSNPLTPIEYQIVLPGSDINPEGWRNLTTDELEDLKKGVPGDIYFQVAQIVTAAEKAEIEAECNKQPSYNNRPPKKDDEENDEIDKLVKELNEMLKEAKPNWKKISELLKEQGIDISPEDLEAMFKPENMDYDHQFRPDPKFKYDPNTGTYRAHMSGHHVDKGICEVQYGIETKLPGGAIQRDVNFKGLLKKDNCYFPNHWTETDVMRATIEVLQNPKAVELSNGRLVIKGISNDVKIIVILDKSKIIKTSYPAGIKI